jgi:chaperonin cofactor prefoldin
LTTITNNQDAILAQLRNITNDISLAVDTKLKAVEERVQKSFEEFEAKIQGHLTPVANLASCES